jgi:hypothetical protein
MGSVESDANDGTAVVDTADEQPTDQTDTANRSVSWGTTAPDWNRLRSFGVGGLLGIAGVVALLILQQLPAIIRGLSLDGVLSIGLLLFILSPIAVHARNEITGDTEQSDRSLRDRLDWSSFRPGWVVGGTVVVGATMWLLSDVLEWFYAIQLAAVFVPLVFQNNWGATKTVDPEAGVIETEQHARTTRRSLDNAVGVRRFDLFRGSLFIFSNRGQQWYKGPHLLSVPADIAPEVDPIFRRLIDESGSPERIDRDERLIIGGVGASMLMMGPVLYLLLGEGALLAITAGPSAIVAHFALMHAHRA